ncbi:MAG: alpha/beta hydrolase [Lentisphaeria bacterium]|nr:alpha/beta hydrolase [Lentisphaeria bacterium]
MASMATAADKAPPAKPVLPPAPAGVILRQDLDYLEPGRAEKLDLYLPAERPAGTRSPAIVFIHGGGWSGGDKAEYRSFNYGTGLAKAGYVMVSVNYWLGREGRWPRNLHDCKNAVRYLRVHADDLGVDPEHIGVIGGSAGGHLALMVAYTTDVAGLEPEIPYPGVSSRVNCVVNLYGITNLLTRQKTDANGKPTGVPAPSGLLSVSREQDPALWRFVSPVNHVQQATPPTLTMHGLMDSTVDCEQARELAAKLDEHGVENQLVLIEGIGHTFNLDTWGRKPLPPEARPTVLGFLERHLRPAERRE